MAAASGVTLEIDGGKVPLFDGVIDLARQNRSGGMTSNQEYFAAGVSAPDHLDERAEDLLSLLYDPQTSGGLLISAAADWSDQVAAALERAGVRAVRIGRAHSQSGGVRVRIVV